MKRLLLTIALGSAGLINAQCVEKPSELSNETKQQRWDAMEKEVDSWIDGMGMPIDPGIKKAVIVLNLLGFETQQSCEGHADRGLFDPWIRFASKGDDQIRALNKELDDVIDRIDTLESEILKKHPDLSFSEAMQQEELSPELNELYTKRYMIGQERDKVTRVVMLPLYKLITNFYKAHSADFDRMLILDESVYDESGAVLPVLSNMGAKWQITRDENEKLQKLKEYQQEMQLFADFLTDYYFNN